MSKIFGFGSVALDFRVITAELGKEYTSKLLAKETLISSGGAVSNSLIQAARLGAETMYLGKLGEDRIGREIVANLEKEGVSTEAVIFDPDAFSPFNVAVYAGEKRRRVGGYLLPNSLASVTEEEILNLSEQMKRGDVLLLEIGEIPFQKSLFMCESAKARGVTVLVDIDLDPILQCGAEIREVEKLFSLADILIPNVECLNPILGENSAEKYAELLSEKYDVTTVITDGERGSISCRPQEKAKRHAPYKVEAVDTVGAGDSFHGSFAFALSIGYSLEEAVAFASVAAAMNCLAFGATTAMPTKKSLENVWNFRKKRVK